LSAASLAALAFSSVVSAAAPAAAAGAGAAAAAAAGAGAAAAAAGAGAAAGFTTNVLAAGLAAATAWPDIFWRWKKVSVCARTSKSEGVVTNEVAVHARRRRV